MTSISFKGGISLLFLLVLAAHDSTHGAQKRPGLIRDTDKAEGKEDADIEKPKEYDPYLAEKNVKIGDFYFKKKNYSAAIERYLEAIDYQPNFVDAYDALGRAYERNGETDKAIRIYNDFLRRNPGSPRIPEFRTKIARLEKKTK